MSTLAGRRPESGTARRRPVRFQVALVGADGAGKSTLCRLLEAQDLPLPVKRLYMGVNLEASTMMLPTTRLLLAVKRRRGGRPDLVGSPAPAPGDGPGRAPGVRASLRATARLGVWVLEEWLRQLVAWRYGRTGHLVVFDRHFLADHFHSDIEAGVGRRPLLRRWHGWMLQHVYPHPDLVVCLDAPAAVLHARKPESSPEWLEGRRQEYLRLAGVVPAFVVVDATRPVDTVLADVVDAIRDHWNGVPA